MPINASALAAVPAEAGTRVDKLLAEIVAALRASGSNVSRVPCSRGLRRRWPAYAI